MPVLRSRDRVASASLGYTVSSNLVSLPRKSLSQRGRRSIRKAGEGKGGEDKRKGKEKRCLPS